MNVLIWSGNRQLAVDGRGASVAESPQAKQNMTIAHVDMDAFYVRYDLTVLPGQCWWEWQK